MRFLKSKVDKTRKIDLRAVRMFAVFFILTEIFVGVLRAYNDGLLLPFANRSIQSSIKTGTQLPPTGIILPGNNALIAIEAGNLEGNSWQLFSDHAGWLSSSGTPGKGTVILYAHNSPRLFGQLQHVAENEIVVVFQNEKRSLYKITGKVSVSPRSVDAVFAKKDDLILYTCDGYFDEKRLVVYAQLI